MATSDRRVRDDRQADRGDVRGARHRRCAPRDRACGARAGGALRFSPQPQGAVALRAVTTIVLLVRTWDASRATTVTALLPGHSGTLASKSIRIGVAVLRLDR